MLSKNVASLRSRLSKVRPTDVEIQVAELTLGKATGKEATRIRKGWASTLGFREDKMVFIGIQTLTKPPIRKLVVIGEDSIGRMPGQNMNDLGYVSRELQLDSVFEVINLFELCNLEFGLVEKNTPAVQIDNLESVEHLPSSVNEERLDEYWWQAWGGILYGIRRRPEGIVISKLGSRTGNYKRLPVWAAR